MTATALRCAVCHVELTTADADDAVKTDAGPVHRECFDGPVPPPDLPDDLLADEQIMLIEPKVGVELPDGADPEAQADFYRRLLGCEDLDLDAENAARRAAGDAEIPACVECGAEPAINGGRCFTCRGKSML